MGGSLPTPVNEAESISQKSGQTPTVAKLLVSLHTLVDWELVAIHLRGMTNDEIQGIKKVPSQNVGEQKRLCFTKWLLLCPDASWDDVVTALEKGKALTLADKVRNEKLIIESGKSFEETTQLQLKIPENEEEEVVHELSKLHHSFTVLLLNVQNTIEKMVKEDKNLLKEIIKGIKSANLKRLGNLTDCKTVDELNDKIICKCSFLDGSILHTIVTFGLPQNSELISETNTHMTEAKKFRKKASIRDLKDQINEKITGNSQAPLVVKLNNVWDRANIDHVTTMIEYLADKEIGSKTIRVLSSSVEVTLLISEDDKPYFNITTEHKEQFMCLIGMFYLQVGENPPIFKEGENEHYTFENGLLEAAKTGHVQAIEFILNIGIGVDYHNNEGKTALLLASEHGHSEAVKSILSAGASVNIQDNIGLTAVMVSKTVDIYQTLVQANANTNIVTHKGSTPLMVSCLHGNHEVANYLLFTLKHNITTRPDEFTLVMAASQGGNEKIVEYLLDNGHDPNTPDENGRTAIGLTSFHGQSKVTEILLKHNADPHIPDNNGWTPLMIASEEGHRKIAELLLQKGVNPNTTNKKNGRTALMQASKEGHNETAKLLLSNGADPNIRINDGRTAIGLTCFHGEFKVTEILLKHDADPHIPDNDGWTPLMVASHKGHHKIVELLLQKGVDPNIINKKNGRTSLMQASRKGQNETVELLLSNGADPNIRDNNGITAIELSCFNGHYTVTKILIEKNTDPNIPDNDGWTPLMSASQEGYHKIVELLLQKGVDPNTTNNKNGRTALMQANRNGHDEIVELLQLYGAKTNIQDIKLLTPIRLSCTASLASTLSQESSNTMRNLTMMYSP